MMLWGSKRCLGQNILAFQQNRKTCFSETAAESKETLIFILLYGRVRFILNFLVFNVVVNNFGNFKFE
jgi:hypothetical protein